MLFCLQVVLFLVAFVIPCIAIVVCYARIFYIVRKTAMKSRLTGRNSTATTTASATTTGASKSSSYYSSGKIRLVKKSNLSSTTDDSALGSVSTGPSYSTDKSSSILDNGTSSELSADTVTIKMVTLNTPLNHNLLSPPSSSPVRSLKIAADPSSSSGVEGNAFDEEEENTSRSVTPTSNCSSMNHSPHNFKSVKRKKRKDRLPSAVLSHVASVFRKGSHMKHNISPRRISSMIPAVPGKMSPKDKKLLKMILVIFAAFVTCYLPITVTKTFRSYIDHRVLNIAGYILIYLTTCINPIIYVVMSSEYRQAYKNLLMCRTVETQSLPQNYQRSASQRA